MSKIFLYSGRNQRSFGKQSHSTSFRQKSDVLSSKFVVESLVMKKIHKQIKGCALSSDPVLITGSYGTGKSSTAYEIFRLSTGHHNRHFVRFESKGKDQDFIDQRFFKAKDNLLSLDNGTSLFIKEIDSWSLALQNKLLRFLFQQVEEKKQLRLLVSSSEDIFYKLKEGRFSKELFERLSRNLLILPPLSKRPEDIPFLIRIFMKKNLFEGCISASAMSVLKSYQWRGNITELEEACSQISTIYPEKEIIEREDIFRIKQEEIPLEKNILKYNPQMSLEKLVNHYIQMSLNHFQSKRKSAEALGISVKTIYNKINNGLIGLE